MTGDEFWALIDATRPAEPDPDVHAQAITQALVERGTADTVAFAREFDVAVDALYRWDVWGAAYLLLGGLSDDGFEYFRTWVVGEGRRAWEQVQADPQGFTVALLDQAIAEGGELYESLAERGVGDGESLLYVAGSAHEQLTGAWTPTDPDHQARLADGPVGDEWDEDDVEAAFPRLAAALAAAEVAGAVNSDQARTVYSESYDIVGGGRLTLEEFAPGAGPVAPGAGGPSDRDAAMSGATSAADLQIILVAVQAADERWDQRDLAGVVGALVPVLDHPVRRTLLSGILPPDLVGDLLYRGGISRLQGGDPDGAAEWFGFALASGVEDGRVRRALAQLELTRGELDRAEELLDTGPGAGPMDLAIAIGVAGYRRDQGEVLRRGEALFAALDRSVDLHPWDVASTHVLLGQALVEVGEGERALAAAGRVRLLVEGAPPEVPLVAQCGSLAAAGHRLVGDLAAAESSLRDVWPLLQPATCDLGTAEREAARIHRASGRPAEAAELYARAVATFADAGEQFLSADTDREAAAV